MVITKIYTEPAISTKEILRYAGCKDAAEESVQLLLDECLREVLPKLSYKICYVELPLEIREDVCDMGCMQVQSKDLARNLQGCESVLLLAATIGVEIDRLITKYGHISPAKAVLLQAIGAERIESLCDAFDEEWQAAIAQDGLHTRPRFSPGYGDLPLEIQKTIFHVLNCSKNIGLSLGDSMLMSPSKSVTAFIGMTKVCGEMAHGCNNCSKTDCGYRKK